MNALDAPFGLTISADGQVLSLRAGRHFRMYPVGKNAGIGEQMSPRQIDLLRIGMAIHVGDGWVKRTSKMCGHRSPELHIEVLDPAFWNQPDTYEKLKKCVDFVSGEDNWSFRFTPASIRHYHYTNLFRSENDPPMVTLYSGGLDSAAGLAVRLAEKLGRVVIPVTIRHQLQHANLIRKHFAFLIDKGLIAKHDLHPFQAGAFIKKKQIEREFTAHFREVTHRCRPFLIMSVAGIVADIVASSEVEIYESGVGSVNLPLHIGPADYRATRSTHPYYLRLISDLISRVNNARMDFVLPFFHFTKGEIVKKLKILGIEEIARQSVSCVLHPLRRKEGLQCGYCPACVFRRQAMIAGGIVENGSYSIDLFSPIVVPNEKHMKPIRAFHQQAGRLRELESGTVPPFFRKYLYETHAISSDDEIAAHFEVHRRYNREWTDVIADARHRGLPWVATSRSLSHGATP